MLGQRWVLTSNLSAAFAASPSVEAVTEAIGLVAAAATAELVIMGPMVWWMFRNFLSVTFIFGRFFPLAGRSVGRTNDDGWMDPSLFLLVSKLCSGVLY